MHRVRIFSLLFILSVSCLYAQNPIKWRSSVKMTSDTEGVIALKAFMQPGWHLYGFDLPKGGPKSTSFDFSNSSGIELIGTINASVKPVEVFDDMFQLTLNWWDANVAFTQHFKIIGKKPSIKGVITYMGCNDQTCTPPRKENITLTIPRQ